MTTDNSTKTFPNLAGVKSCDQTILNELVEAGIRPITLQASMRSEVPAAIIGILGQFTFQRAWYYWVVKGSVPLPVAEEMYANPIGKEDVRVSGHCGCPPPIEYARPRCETSVDIQAHTFTVKYEQYEMVYSWADGSSPTKARILADMKEAGITPPLFVDSYHIDSQVGLNLFTSTIRKYGLDK